VKNHQSRTLLVPLLGVLCAVSAHAQDRPGDNATAARIADGVEKARDGKLLDAVEQFQRVLDTAGDELVPVDHGQLTPARWVVHGQIARLPAEGVRLYRQRVDGQAVKRLDEAKKARDDSGLQRLLADMFAAKATEEAILELARRAFERADFDAAEHFWRMLLPPQSDDDRLLRFPDPKTPPAAIQGRLILVKLFRGDRDEAKANLQALRDKWPDAAGLLAGKTGKFVETLTELFNDPAQTTLPRVPDEPGWPTFASSPARTGTNRAKLPYFWPDEPTWKVSFPSTAGERFDGPRPDPLHPRALVFYPVVSGGRAYITDGGRVWAIDLATGTKARAAAPEPDGGQQTPLPSRHDVRHTLTESDGILYARLGPEALKAGDGGRSFLVAIGPPPAEGGERKVLWRLDPPAAENATTHFEGAPVVRSGRLFAAFWRQAGGEAQAGVACYRIDDPDKPPDLVWQRIVGRAGSEPNGETRFRHNLVTLSGPNVVYCTDGGTVIALDMATGRPAWEYRYPRDERPTLPRYRDLCPPVADGGRIYAAPADTDRLLCLDAYTGRLVWEREGVEVIHLLGVARGRLIATFGGPGRGIRGLNLRTGADSGPNGWTLHDDGGAGTFGRGLVTEEAIVWPTRRGLYFLDPADGTMLRSPIPGPSVTFRGVALPTETPLPFGNLCYADGVLLVSTATEVWGFVSEAKKLGGRRKAVEGDPADPTKHADLARSLIDAGQYAEAEAEAAKAGDTKDRLRWLLAEKLIRDGKRGEAKRLYDELAKGDGSFAAAGAARVAEMCDDPEKQRAAWRVVFAKKGTIRDEHGVPWPARTYAETRSPALLTMRGVGTREDDFVGAVDSNSPAKPPVPLPVYVRASATTDGPPAVTNRWRLAYRPDDPILAPPTRPALPAASGANGPAALEDVQADSATAEFIYDQRYLVRASPAEGYGRVRAAPPGTTAGLQPHSLLTGRFDLAQTTDGRMLVWDDGGRRPREFPSTRKPWPQPPADVGHDQFLIPDDDAVVLFDAKAGKELARYTLPGEESLTGEPPRFRLNQGDVLLLIDRNHGVEVDRLRTVNLKRVWSRPAVLVGRSLDDLAVATDRFFVAADGLLAAYSWRDGQQLWEAPLPDVSPTTWKVAVTPQALLAYPTEAMLRHPGFDAVGEFRRAGWDATALLRAISRTYDVWADRELPVLVIDPHDGRLVQRLTFPAAGPAAGVAVTPKGVVVVTGRGNWTLTTR
jgi:outer membrane protein assembly factor BamB